MKRIVPVLIVLFAAGSVFSAAQEEQLTPEQIQTMEEQLKTVGDPAARLFYQANLYRAKGEIEKALKTLAELTVFHASEKDWVSRSELLSAKLYQELGMLDAADVTARQVELLNEGTDAAQTARRFREKLKETEPQSEATE